MFTCYDHCSASRSIDNSATKLTSPHTRLSSRILCNYVVNMMLWVHEPMHCIYKVFRHEKVMH